MRNHFISDKIRNPKDMVKICDTTEVGFMITTTLNYKQFRKLPRDQGYLWMEDELNPNLFYIRFFCRKNDCPPEFINWKAYKKSYKLAYGHDSPYKSRKDWCKQNEKEEK